MTVHSPQFSAESVEMTSLRVLLTRYREIRTCHLRREINKFMTHHPPMMTTIRNTPGRLAPDGWFINKSMMLLWHENQLRSIPITKRAIDADRSILPTNGQQWAALMFFFVVVFHKTVEHSRSKWFDAHAASLQLSRLIVSITLTFNENRETRHDNLRCRHWQSRHRHNSRFAVQKMEHCWLDHSACWCTSWWILPSI